jgi:hypothetical protein
MVPISLFDLNFDLLCQMPGSSGLSKLYSIQLARLLIQIGAPTNPNSARIWFSRNRS